jgi:type IV secretory pathway VirB9-like protein
MQKYWDSYNANQSQSADSSSTIAQLPDIHLNTLNFNYSIEKPFFNSPRWKPTRVFDDGVHTYIEVPDSVSSSDLPALFVVDAVSAKKALVNYRYKKPYFIVDKTFKKAVLILGVGHNQSKVTLINENI